MNTLTNRAVTTSISHAGLICDDFRRSATYANWRPQGSGDYLLIYTYSGQGLLVSPHGQSTCVKGDVVLYTLGESQDYSTAPEPGKWNLLYAHFRPRPLWQPWLTWPVNKEGLRLLHLDGEPRRNFVFAMREMIRLSRLPIPEAQDLATNALEKAVLWIHVAIANTDWLTLDSRVRNAMDFLITNVKAPFNMAALARNCNLSESRMAHLFKDEARTTPQKFLEDYRMQQACGFLRATTMTIEEVAAEVGYLDAFYFTNRFRKRLGKSPSKFRQQSNPNLA